MHHTIYKYVAMACPVFTDVGSVVLIAVQPSRIDEEAVSDIYILDLESFQWYKIPK